MTHLFEILFGNTISLYLDELENLVFGDCCIPWVEYSADVSDLLATFKSVRQFSFQCANLGSSNCIHSQIVETAPLGLFFRGIILCFLLGRRYSVMVGILLLCCFLIYAMKKFASICF